MHLTIEKAKAEVRKILVISGVLRHPLQHYHPPQSASRRRIPDPDFKLCPCACRGLIAAKVSLTVDHLPFFDAFPHKPMIYNIGWKTSLYAVGAMGFLYAEPFVKHLVKGAGFYVSPPSMARA